MPTTVIKRLLKDAPLNSELLNLSEICKFFQRAVDMVLQQRNEARSNYKRVRQELLRLASSMDDDNDPYAVNRRQIASALGLTLEELEKETAFGVNKDDRI